MNKWKIFETILPNRKKFGGVFGVGVVCISLGSGDSRTVCAADVSGTRLLGDYGGYVVEVVGDAVCKSTAVARRWNYAEKVQF